MNNSNETRDNEEKGKKKEKEEKEEEQESRVPAVEMGYQPIDILDTTKPPQKEK